MLRRGYAPGVGGRAPGSVQNRDPGDENCPGTACRGDLHGNHRLISPFAQASAPSSTIARRLARLREGAEGISDAVPGPP